MPSPAPPISLSARLDEAAPPIRSVAPIRIGLTVLGITMAGLVTSLALAGVWAAVALAVEIWNWFSTAPYVRRSAITPRRRANFVASYAALNIWWLVLAVLLCTAGSVEGRVSGGVLLVALASVGVLLFHNVPVVFLWAGAAPTGLALLLFALEREIAWSQLLPVGLALATGLIFNFGRALESPSVQTSQRLVNDALRKYETLADNISDIIGHSDMAGRYEYVSPGCQRVLGYTPDELLAISRQNLLHPDSFVLAGAALQRLLADPQGQQVVEVQLRHKDGHWLWVQSVARLVCEDGVPVGVIDVTRDITQRMEADAELRLARTEAEAANLAKAEFLANVSHEIRTPMNGVLGALHILGREHISPEGRELMQQANDCGRTLTQLLNDILDFSRIQTGTLELAPEPGRVGEALDSAMVVLADQARAKGLELRAEIEGGDLWIVADPDRLRQAVFNLLANAVKFTPAGHVTARLRARAGDAGGCHVRLEVEDTGIGMSADAQAHLFERFRQAESDNTRRFGGAGLGLAIVQALARMMGGDVGFTSVAGEGSTFWMEFTAPLIEAVESETLSSPLLSGVHILLVEDNLTNRIMARTILTDLGASVDEAEDGLEALLAASNGAHDLILMDVQMPNMDGVEATRAIRALPSSVSRVPIIALTANVLAEQRALYLAAGMNSVVAKPISVGTLVSAIIKALSQAEPVEDAAVV